MSVATVRRVVCRLGPDRPPTDAELVAALAGPDRDAAFAELVGRYGPMVLGVCRRVLADVHDAEDAFQAAFLVLARRFGTVRPPGAVGGWLYGVAVRTARKAKTAAARRRRREMAATVPANPVCEVGSELQRAELRAVIDAELAALPDPHRAAVVLCDLHGKTRAEAALELNRPEGTVAAWLARGRKALAARLARRGVALPAAGLLAVAAPSAVSAELASAATAVLVRGASTAVLALAEGVMRSLSSGTTKLVAAVVAAGALMAAVATASGWRADEPRADAPPVAAAAPDAPEPRGPVRDAPPAKPVKWREKAVIEVNDLVDSVAVDPDGTFIAAGTLGGEGQNTVTVWDAGTLKKLWTGGVLPAGVTAVAFTPDGKTLAATRDKVTGFYEAATGKSILMNPPLPGGHAVAFSPNGERIAVSNGKQTVVPDLPTRGEVSMTGPPAVEKNPARLPAGVAWSPDGKRLAMIRHEKWQGKWPVLVWGAGSGEGMELLAGHNDTVTAVAWSKDGALLASGGADGDVVIWDGKKFKELRRVSTGGGKGQNAVHALAFAPDGKTLAAGLTLAEGKNVDRVALIDTATGDRVQDIQPLSGAPVAVAFTPDGKTLLVGCGSRDPDTRKLALDDRKKFATLRLFTADPEPAPPAPAAAHTEVSFSPDGAKYLAARGDKAEVFDAATGRLLYEVVSGAPRSGMMAGQFSADGRKLFLIANKVLECDADTGRFVRSADLPKTKWERRRIAFAPGGTRYAVHFGPHVRVYDTATGFEPVRLDGQFETANWFQTRTALGPSVTFSPDGKRVAAVGVPVARDGVLVSKDGQAAAAVWDAETGAPLRTFAADLKDGPRCAAFRSGGDELALAFKDRVEVWTVGEAKKNPVRTFRTLAPVTAIAYSADGKQLAIAVRAQSFDRQRVDLRVAYKGEVLVLDAMSGEKLRTLGGFGRDPLLIDGATGRVLDPRAAGGLWVDPLVTALAFAPDGKKLLAATGFPATDGIPAGIPKTGDLKLFDLTAP